MLFHAPNLVALVVSQNPGPSHGAIDVLIFNFFDFNIFLPSLVENAPARLPAYFGKVSNLGLPRKTIGDMELVTFSRNDSHVFSVYIFEGDDLRSAIHM